MFGTNNLFSDIKSLNYNVCAQIFIHKVGFSAVHPMRSEPGDTIGQSYKDLCHDYVVPEHLNFDVAIAQVDKNTLFMKTINKYDMRYHISIPIIPNDKPTEGAIREINK